MSPTNKGRKFGSIFIKSYKAGVTKSFQAPLSSEDSPALHTIFLNRMAAKDKEDVCSEKNDDDKMLNWSIGNLHTF